MQARCARQAHILRHRKGGKALRQQAAGMAQRQILLIALGRPVAEAVRSIGVTEVTYYRWRSEYGGLKGDQVKRLKELEVENQRLRRAVSCNGLSACIKLPVRALIQARLWCWLPPAPWPARASATRAKACSKWSASRL